MQSGFRPGIGRLPQGPPVMLHGLWSEAFIAVNCILRSTEPSYLAEPLHARLRIRFRTRLLELNRVLCN
jgi:hypothetical protein